MYFLKTKKSQEYTTAFRDVRAYVKTQFNCEIKRLRCDNGRGEYDNGLFKSELMQSGTQYEPAPPYTQHMNGVSERMIQTLNTNARALMIDAHLPPKFWAEAVNTAAYLHQRTPTKTLNGTTPYERLFSRKLA